MSEKAKIRLKNISKDYLLDAGYKINLLKNISFEINESSFTTILSPAGAGKTTLLKIIAGLENPTDGNIESPSEMRIFFIPQKPSSFPWWTLKQNIENVLENKSDVDINEIIREVGLEGYEDHLPNNSSIGFRFRISLARALALNPKLILLDDIFQLMDPRTKGEIFILLKKINKEKGISFLLATNNIQESLFLSDELILMKKQPGEIITQLKIDFTEERNLDLFKTSEYFDKRKKVEEIIKSNNTQQLLNFSI